MEYNAALRYYDTHLISTARNKKQRKKERKKERKKKGKKERRKERKKKRKKEGKKERRRLSPLPKKTHCILVCQRGIVVCGKLGNSSIESKS